MLVSSHVDRWERGDLTTREVTTIANHPDPRLNLFCSGVLGGRQQTCVLLRVVCLMLMKARAEKLKTKLVYLTPNAYTVDEEVMTVPLTLSTHPQPSSHPTLYSYLENFVIDYTLSTSIHPLIPLISPSNTLSSLSPLVSRIS